MALSTTQYGYIFDPMVPFTDDKGKTIKNGFVRVFVAGSSTPVITYRNFDGATNQDRIELDNSGRTKTSVIGSKGLTYKVCVYDKDHSQESPILTVDKVSVIGANITAGAGATVVTGLDGLTTKPDGFVDASVVGTDGYVALDHTLVTDDLDTDAKVSTVEDDRYIPLLNEEVNDPDSKMTLGRLWQWVLGKIKSLSTTITAFRSGDYIPVDGPSGTAKMGKDGLLKITAENALEKVNNTENLSFITKSAQRFNYQDVTRGYYYYNSGTFVDDASYVKSEFIRIGEEITMWFNKIAHITFWDENGNYVGGAVNGSEAWSSAISIPAGAYYVCVGTLKNTSRNAVLNFGNSHLVLADLSEYRYWEDLKFGIDRTCNTFKLPFVKDRKLCCNIVSATRTAYYSSVNLGSNVYKFNVSWIWEAGTSTGTIAVIINPNGMNRIKNITDSSIHLTLTANKLKVDCLGNKWGEYYYANLIDHTFDTPMDLDGTTEHTISLTINLNGENIAVNVDGDSYAGVFSDTHGNNLHLSDFYGPYATIEHYCEGNRNDKAMPMFTSFKVLAISTPSAFDYFERENGVLQCTPTGHPYSLMVNDSRFA